MAEPARAVRTAVIPVAGMATRHFPASRAVPKGLFPLVDTDGVTRPVAHVIARQAVGAGIERVVFIVSPGQDGPLRAYFCVEAEAPAKLGERGRREAREIADLAGRIAYVVQPTPEGFGHAVWCAREAVESEPFLLMLGDFVYLPLEADDVPPVRQVLEAYAAAGGVAMVGLQLTPGEQLHLHGTLRGEFLGREAHPSLRLLRMRDIVEKPDPQTARRRLVTPFLPPNAYLTHAGLYVFGRELFEALGSLVQADRREGGEIQLATAEAMLMEGRDDFHGWLVQGTSLDMGTPSGLVHAVSSLGFAAGLLGDRSATCGGS